MLQRYEYEVLTPPLAHQRPARVEGGPTFVQMLSGEERDERLAKASRQPPSGCMFHWCDIGWGDEAVVPIGAPGSFGDDPSDADEPLIPANLGADGAQG
jgi:hypothetical protein